MTCSATIRSEPCSIRVSRNGKRVLIELVENDEAGTLIGSAYRSPEEARALATYIGVVASEVERP